MKPELLARTAARRAAYLRKLDTGVALLPGARSIARSADADYPFRQDSDFYYLTAFDEPDAVCILRPGASPSFVLFVRPRDRNAEVWTGRRFGVEGAQQIYGADAAYPIGELDARLPELLQDSDVLHYALGRDAGMDERVRRVVAEHRRTRPRRGRGIVRLDDPATILHEMRLVKDEDEVACMRTAAAITVAAHQRLLDTARPGMREYELQAIAEEEFRRRGARGPAYSTIVGGGANATVLHYVENQDPLRDGELVLVDAGCEFDLYAADVTRTWPVGAAFTPEQAAVYGVVLEAQRQALAAVRPGASCYEPHERALEILCAGLVDLGLLAGPLARVLEAGAAQRFFMHRTSHWLGLDVHDVGTYVVTGGNRRLEPGMVLTVEPGLYFATDDVTVPEAFRGIGVRIEDDALVTAAGAEILTAGAPKEPSEIEMRRAAALAGRA